MVPKVQQQMVVLAKLGHGTVEPLYSRHHLDRLSVLIKGGVHIYIRTCNNFSEVLSLEN